MAADLLIRNAEVAGRNCDVLLRDGVVAGVDVPPRTGAPCDELDAAGGALIPGLHDHHAHLLAYAAALESLDVGGTQPGDLAAFAGALRAADRRLPAGAWLRVTGYHESIQGPLDREALDRLVPGRPVRVQHRSGAMWTLNTKALELARVDAGLAPGIEVDEAGRPNGRLHRLDDWLRRRTGGGAPDLRAAVRRLGRYGVTGVTDATPFGTGADLEPLARGVEDGLDIRVVITGAPGLVPRPVGGLHQGPRKIVIADHALPSLDDVVAMFRHARGERHSVAVHSVTLESLLLALAAWDEVGAKEGDRLEHGAVVPPEQARRLARHGITVVTQPSFVWERGDDYLRDVDPRDVPYLYPCRSLLDNGVAVGFSTDAPFGPADPWTAIAAATRRRTSSGQTLASPERIPAGTALERFLSPWQTPGGTARRILPGTAADLCLLRAPLRDVLADPSSELVAATVVGGRVVNGP